MRGSPLLLVLACVLTPSVAAHTALTVTPPADPVAPFTTVAVDVDAAAECLDTFVGVPPAAEATRDLALSDATPAGLAWTGETLTFAAADCIEGQGDSEQSGTVLVTPDGSSPAFQPLALEVVCEECEDGGFTMQVGYFANLTARVPSSLRTGTPFAIALDVATNADTELRLTVAKAGAHASLTTLPTAVAVDSPLVDGLANRTVLLVLQASGPATGWSSDEVELRIAPAAVGHAANGTAIIVKLPLANGAPATSPSSSSTPSKPAGTATGSTNLPTGGSGSSSSSASATKDEGTKDSPPASPLLAIALVAVGAAVLRRRL